MPEEAQKLLEAEEAVHELLEHLEQLKGEIQGYAEAKGSLDQSRQAVEKLAADVGNMVNRSAGIIQTLSSVGTPEIVERIERLDSAFKELSKLTGGLGSAHEDIIARLEKVHNGLVGVVRHIEQTVTKVAQDHTNLAAERGQKLTAKLRLNYLVLSVLVLVSVLLGVAAVALHFPAVRQWFGLSP